MVDAQRSHFAWTLVAIIPLSHGGLSFWIIPHWQAQGTSQYSFGSIWKLTRHVSLLIFFPHVAADVTNSWTVCNLYTSSLQPWRMVSETPQVRKPSILIIEHTYSCSVIQNLGSHGTLPSLVPLLFHPPLPTIAGFQQWTLCPLAHVPFYTHHWQLTQALLWPPPHLPLHMHPKQPISGLLTLLFHLPHHWLLYTHWLCTLQPQCQCHPFPNVNVVTQKGAWRSSLWYTAHIENLDSLLELGISRGWGCCWVRMQLKQQRDQGDNPRNRFHHLFLWNSEKWYVLSQCCFSFANLLSAGLWNTFVRQRSFFPSTLGLVMWPRIRLHKMCFEGWD